MPAAANPDPTTQPRDFLLHLFQAAVARAQPAQVLAGFLPPPPQGRTVVLGAGKAAGAMAHALEAAWPADAPLRGLVVTRHGHTPRGGVTVGASISLNHHLQELDHGSFQFHQGSR